MLVALSINFFLILFRLRLDSATGIEMTKLELLTRKKDDIMQMVGIVFLYCIWTGKIRRRPISFPTLEENMFLIFDGIADSYKWVSDMATNSDDYWSRHWRGRTGGGRG